MVRLPELSASDYLNKIETAWQDYRKDEFAHLLSYRAVSKKLATYFSKVCQIDTTFVDGLMYVCMYVSIFGPYLSLSSPSLIFDFYFLPEP